MTQHVGLVAMLVRDYDEAISFYTDKLGFSLVEDLAQGSGKRWVVVAPPGANETRLLLAKAANDEQAGYVGNQTGGRVFLFLYTDNFNDDYAFMQNAGVRFLEAPRNEGYGTVVVFEDLYGNKWDLLQLKQSLAN